MEPAVEPPPQPPQQHAATSSTNTSPTPDSTTPPPPADGDSPPSSPAPDNTAVAAAVPPSSENTNNDSQQQQQQAQQQRSTKKGPRKKRKPQTEEEKHTKKAKKRKSKDGTSTNGNEEGGTTTATTTSGRGGKRPRNKGSRRGGSNGANHDSSLSAAQLAVNEQMRRALEDDKYSALGSIVDTDTDEDEHDFRTSRGSTIRLDRNTILSSMRKRMRTQRLAGSNVAIVTPTTTTPVVLKESSSVLPDSLEESSHHKKRKVKTIPPRSKNGKGSGDASSSSSRGGPEKKGQPQCTPVDNNNNVMNNDDILGRDEGSIFGQTSGASNATWVECDKCKKWRRLRGVVDEKKLPSKWYCSMNKNDPERARCSAPEEDYETPNTPESAADARTRKHLRVWVRRLESHENYEARMHPASMTRGKKRSAAASSKEPYEWIRCCNPSCGKWRALLRCMDAKQHVIDQTLNGEWYCVMNTWDEKMASCAAPQENLPVIGCPPWVMQDAIVTTPNATTSSSSSSTAATTKAE